MASVAEQLQRYRAINASKMAALKSHHPLSSVPFTHPNTQEYFKALMKRWQDQDNNEMSNLQISQK